MLNLRTERQAWELLLNYVGAPRLGISGVPVLWSVRDIIAHVIPQQQYLADRLSEIARDEIFVPCKTQAELDTFLEEFGYPDFDSPLLNRDNANDRIVGKYRSVSLQELVAHEIHAFDAIYEAAQKLSEGLLNEANLYGRIARYTYEHYRHHAADIRARFKAPLER